MCVWSFPTRHPGLRLSSVADLHDELVASQQLPHGGLVWAGRTLGVGLAVEHGERQRVHAAVHAQGHEGLWTPALSVVCNAVRIRTTPHGVYARPEHKPL